MSKTHKIWICTYKHNGSHDVTIDPDRAAWWRNQLKVEVEEYEVGQTTPTRDEVVPADERRIDLPSGYYLFQIRPSDMTCSLHMPDGLHIGNLLAQYAGADFAAAMLASAPAPASGGVDAVADFPMGAIENGRAFADRLEMTGLECPAGDLRMCSDWQEFRRCFEYLAEWALPRASLSPAATTVSEAEPVAWMHPTAGWFAPSRDTIAMHCRSGEPPVPVYLGKPASSPAGEK